MIRQNGLAGALHRIGAENRILLNGDGRIFVQRNADRCAAHIERTRRRERRIAENQTGSALAGSHHLTVAGDRNQSIVRAGNAGGGRPVDAFHGKRQIPEPERRFAC